MHIDNLKWCRRAQFLGFKGFIGFINMKKADETAIKPFLAYII